MPASYNDFLQLLNAVPIPIFYRDAEHGIVNRNAAATRLVARVEDRAAILRIVSQAADRPSAHGRQQQASGSTYTVHPVGVVPGLLGPRVHSLVIVLEKKAEARRRLSTEELRLRFRLTKQQSRIASALAAGLSNQEIADRLSLSPHTVRRHTEQVMSKLNVRSRAQVAHALLFP